VGTSLEVYRNRKITIGVRHRITPNDGNTTSDISGLEQSYKNTHAFG
jgi:hypothetical protein